MFNLNNFSAHCCLDREKLMIIAIVGCQSLFTCMMRIAVALYPLLSMGKSMARTIPLNSSIMVLAIMMHCSFPVRGVQDQDFEYILLIQYSTINEWDFSFSLLQILHYCLIYCTKHAMNAQIADVLMRYLYQKKILVFFTFLIIILITWCVINKICFCLYLCLVH